MKSRSNNNQSKVKLLLTTLLEICLLLVPLWFISSLPTLASSLTSQSVAVASLSKPNLSEDIEQFLTSIPKDYYTVMKVDALKNISDLVLIDVREPSEYHAGHIPKAINVSLNTLGQNLAQIPKDRPVVLYCSTGYRTAMGVMALHMLGYTNVRGFPPSIEGWKAAGEPLELS